MDSNSHCKDIYEEEFRKRIISLKNNRHLTSRIKNSSYNLELFQYTDKNHYSYESTLSFLNRGTNGLLIDILCKVMSRYDISYTLIEQKKRPIDLTIPVNFDFYIEENNYRTGFVLGDPRIDLLINKMPEYSLDEAFIIKPLIRESADNTIQNANRLHFQENEPLCEITLADFFLKYFNEDEYCTFLTYLDSYLKEAKSVIGFKTTPIQSYMNPSMLVSFVDKTIHDFNYEDYTYQIIDTFKNKDYAPVINSRTQDLDHIRIREQYFSSGLYRTLFGTNDYSRSLLTSEWLYSSLGDTENYDYTAIITGYLKSIEQLLSTIINLNVNNQCKIACRNPQKASPIYYEKKNSKDIEWLTHYDSQTCDKTPYTDHTKDNYPYISNDIGAYQHFIRVNPHALNIPDASHILSAMIGCFRNEFRNEYFHKKNLYNKETVKIVRENTFYLYYLLIGLIKVPSNRVNLLGLPVKNAFDEMCHAIRETQYYGLKYLFEYSDGSQKKLVYDRSTNAVEYPDGNEHYDRLRFFEVDDFKDAYEQLDKGINDDQIITITRNNMPSKVSVMNNRTGELILIFSNGATLI